MVIEWCYGVQTPSPKPPSGMAGAGAGVVLAVLSVVVSVPLVPTSDSDGFGGVTIIGWNSRRSK